MELAEWCSSSRVIILAGKGGVGKTTTAAALSVAAARVGRRVLLAFAKVAVLAVAAGVAAGVGGLAYLLSGSRWPPALAAAWVVLAGCAAGLVPVLALAFRRFDVARDTPGNG